jgi:membrane protein
MVSVYALVADPITVANETDALGTILPPEALSLIVTWLQTLIHAPHAQFGFGLVVGVVFAFWSGFSASSMMMTALTICYGERETRGFLAFNLRAVVITAGLALVAIVPLVVLAVSAADIALDAMPPLLHDLISFLRWPVLAAIDLIVLAFLYRYAPDRRRPRWQWLSWGAVTATALWLVASVGFSFYVSTFGSYDRTYGSLGAVMILLLWFYLSAYVTLLGAELNAEIERYAKAPHPKHRAARPRSEATGAFTAPRDPV